MRKAAIDCLESSGKKNILSSAVVAQLVERVLSNPEIHGLHPVIGNFVYYQLYSINCKEGTKI